MIPKTLGTSDPEEGVLTSMDKTCIRKLSILSGLNSLSGREDDSTGSCDSPNDEKVQSISISNATNTDVRKTRLADGMEYGLLSGEG